MARLSMNEMTTYRWSFEEDVAHYGRGGFPALGVWRAEAVRLRRRKRASSCSKRAEWPFSLLWAGGFTGSDGRTFRESLETGSKPCGWRRDAAGCLVVYTGAAAGQHTITPAAWCAMRCANAGRRPICASTWPSNR